MNARGSSEAGFGEGIEALSCRTKKAADAANMLNSGSKTDLEITRRKKKKPSMCLTVILVTS